MKKVEVLFRNSKYDFITSVDDEITNTQIHNYYVHNVFNFGIDKDNLQECIDVNIHLIN